MNTEAKNNSNNSNYSINENLNLGRIIIWKQIGFYPLFVIILGRLLTVRSFAEGLII